MSVPEQEIQRRMARFREGLQRAGIRLTHQRLEIFREVAGSLEHPDAETVYSRVRERLPTVSLDTVYRTLWLLRDLGLISTLSPARDRARFDANLDTHHHFVCTECGMTRDFTSESFDALEIPESVHQFGRIEKTHVEITGVCFHCAEKKQPGRKPSEKREKSS